MKTAQKHDPKPVTIVDRAAPYRVYFGDLVSTGVKYHYIAWRQTERGKVTPLRDYNLENPNKVLINTVTLVPGHDFNLWRKWLEYQKRWMQYQEDQRRAMEAAEYKARDSMYKIRDILQRRWKDANPAPARRRPKPLKEVA